jgi:hypothetical protein
MPKLQKRHEVVQPLDGSYRLIPLTQGQTAIVDVADFDWLSKWNWQAHWNVRANAFYAIRHLTGGSAILMHRLIAGTPKKQECDHWNHDTLDNRRKNLRQCTRAQNMMNERPRREGQYKGVHKRDRKKSESWRSMIRVKKKLVHLGTFRSSKDAARAYDQAAKKYFGHFACLNFPIPNSH